MKTLFLALILSVSLIGCGSGESDGPKSVTKKVKVAEANSGSTRFGPPPGGEETARRGGQGAGTPTSASPASSARRAPTSRPTARPTSRPAAQPAPSNTTASAKSQEDSAVSGEISGKISVSSELAGQVKPGHSLFIMVRRDAGEGQRGMILAVDKIRLDGPDDFPLRYTLTGRHVMTPGTVLAGSVRISARVDQDGDALSKQPGDLTGTHPKAVDVNGDPVHFTLDSKI